MIKTLPANNCNKSIKRKAKNKLDDSKFLKSVRQNSTYRYTYDPKLNKF